MLPNVIYVIIQNCNKYKYFDISQLLLRCYFSDKNRSLNIFIEFKISLC